MTVTQNMMLVAIVLAVAEDCKENTQFLLKAEGSNTWPEKFSPLELAASWAGAAVAMTLSCNLPLLYLDRCRFVEDLHAPCVCSELCMPDAESRGK